MTRVRRLGKALHQLKRRIILKAPARVRFSVDEQEFTIYGTYGGNHGLGHDFARNGCHEPVLSRLLIQSLQHRGPTTQFWDIGSAFGYFSVIAAHQIAPERVHAFEPSASYGYLEYNNRRLFDGRLHISKAFASNHAPAGESAVLLDDYANEHGDPGVVKIDVDGGEIDVLGSAMQTLRRALPTLFLEVHFTGSIAYRQLRPQLIRLLEQLPYNFSICRNHRRHEIALEPLQDVETLPAARDGSFDHDDYLLVASATSDLSFAGHPSPGAPTASDDDPAARAVG